MRIYAKQPSGTVARARTLLRAASPVERRLLRGLREAFPQLKWRHQAPVGPFYADILCFSEGLVIEIDGDSHADAQHSDARRTVMIEREGFRVIRFTNADVTANLEGVLAAIAGSLKSPSPLGASRLVPSPTGRGEERRSREGVRAPNPNKKSETE